MDSLQKLEKELTVLSQIISGDAIPSIHGQPEVPLRPLVWGIDCASSALSVADEAYAMEGEASSTATTRDESGRTFIERPIKVCCCLKLMTHKNRNLIQMNVVSRCRWQRKCHKKNKMNLEKSI